MTFSISYGGDSAAGSLATQALVAQWDEVVTLLSDAGRYKNEADDATATVPEFTAGEVGGSITLPTAPTLDLDYDTASDLYSATEEEILSLLRGSFTSFLSTYFPKRALYDDMLDWCSDAVSTGGSGIATDVERALWERDRARVNAEMARSLADAEELWANRGFPVPAGALLHQQNQIRIAAAQQLSESSRTVAIKSFDTEVENVRFAVKTVIDQQQVALDAARNYILALAQAPQIAQELASSFAGLRNQVAQALVALYTAEVAALDPSVRIAITDAQLVQATSEANQKASLQVIDEKVKAALTAAELSGRVAAAAVNAFSARVDYSGRED